MKRELGESVWSNEGQELYSRATNLMEKCAAPLRNVGVAEYRLGGVGNYKQFL